MPGKREGFEPEFPGSKCTKTQYCQFDSTEMQPLLNEENIIGTLLPAKCREAILK
jgi:hypothetical protein